MKDLLRRITIGSTFVSIPVEMVANLVGEGLIYKCSSPEHDFHIAIDNIDDDEKLIPLFSAVVVGHELWKAMGGDKNEADGIDFSHLGSKAKPAQATDEASTDLDALRLTLRPGDTIVLTPKDEMSDVAAKRLADEVMAATGGNKVLILEPGMSIRVMGTDPWAAPAEPKPESSIDKAAERFRTTLEDLNAALGHACDIAAASGVSVSRMDSILTEVESKAD